MNEAEIPDAPAINGVIETILYVDDLPRGVAFYRDVLGLDPMKGDAARFQTFNSGAGRVLILFKRGGTLEPTAVQGGVIPSHNGTGPHHIGFAIAAADYERWKTRLIAREIVIESETKWERGGKSLYFRDPDGHLLELITPGIWAIY